MHSQDNGDVISLIWPNLCYAFLLNDPKILILVFQILVFRLQINVLFSFHKEKINLANKLVQMGYKEKKCKLFFDNKEAAFVEEFNN